MLDKNHEIEIVNLCRQFKTDTWTHSAQKKMRLRKIYAYLKLILEHDDLMPNYTFQQTEDTWQPKIFIPMMRQIAKQLYAALKGSIFPNQDGFLRIRGTDEEAAAFESDLTDAMVELFKRENVADKLANAIWKGIWGGTPSIHAWMRTRTIYTNVQDPSAPMGFSSAPNGYKTDLQIETLNPVRFYLDPFLADHDDARWLYVSNRKVHELKDMLGAMNTDRLDAIKGQTYQKTNGIENLDVYNQVNSVSGLTEDSVEYCLYYMPYMKMQDGTEYRNMLIGIAGDTVLVQLIPNTDPEGKNPLIWTYFMPEDDSPYGIGPMEEITDLQKFINIFANYSVERLARNGNYFAVTEGVQIEDLPAGIGAVFTGKNTLPIRDQVNQMVDNMPDVAAIMNAQGILKSEAQILAGASNPFQGAADADFKKTATEAQLINQNSVTINQETIEHLVNALIQPACDRIVRLLAETQESPVNLLKIDQNGVKTWMPVDIGVLVDRKKFRVEITSVNMSQSKAATVNILKELFQIAMSNPMLFAMLKGNGYPLMKRILQLNGEKDVDQFIYTPEEMAGRIMENDFAVAQQQQEAALAGMEAYPDPGMEGVSVA